MSHPVSWKSPRTRQASRMATISACAVGSLPRVTWLVPVAITTPSLTTRAANGPPSRRTLATAISTACLMSELDIRVFCGAAGYPWVTIRSDEKHPYFSALERAQVDADVQPLGDFLALHIAQAVSAATDGGPGRGRVRR